MPNSQITAQVKEIFKSIQGEGPYVGFEQIFIRFCKCNLSCDYCDTDFFALEKTKSYTSQELVQEIENLNIGNIHSISLTGGEPLLEFKFLKEFLPLINKKIYLETNGTLPESLSEIIDMVDIVSMDIKLPSVTKMEESYQRHKEFIDICTKNKKEIFLKIVFDKNITDKEIDESVKLAKKDTLLIVLQPMMLNDSLNTSPVELMAVFEKFAQRYSNVRLIPQVHKFINVI